MSPHAEAVEKFVGELLAALGLDRASLSEAQLTAVRALADRTIPCCPDCDRLGNSTLVVCGKHEEYV